MFDLRNGNHSGKLSDKDVQKFNEILNLRDKAWYTFPPVFMLKVKLYWGDTVFYYPAGLIACYFGNSKWWLGFTESGDYLRVIYLNSLNKTWSVYALSYSSYNG